jgi:hypothetical protein
MNNVPKHFRVSVCRMDHPEDPPDWLDEANAPGLTVELLANRLRRRYGPHLRADVEADGVRYEVTWHTIRRT